MYSAVGAIIIYCYIRFFRRVCSRLPKTTQTKKPPKKAFPIRDYKKIKNILMGTPASASNKEGSDFSESSLF